MEGTRTRDMEKQGGAAALTAIRLAAGTNSDDTVHGNKDVQYNVTDRWPDVCEYEPRTLSALETWLKRSLVPDRDKWQSSVDTSTGNATVVEE